jgi:Endonuclease NucS
MENDFPGLWQRWLKNQCVAVGWASEWGYFLNDSPKPSKRKDGWIPVRNRLKEIKIGDYVLVSLQGNRVGRLGEVTGLAIKDADWFPLVPRSKKLPVGGIGRRIFVRWNLTVGPDNRDLVVKLPENARLNSGQLRRTIAKINLNKLDNLCQAMNDPRNWVSLFEFPYEKSLSDYIAAYPHRLEDGFLPHPNKKVRERAFSNGKRVDVLLADRNDKPVIVECKQGGPTVRDIKQIEGYLKQFREKEEEKARGILVHGGARKLREDVRQAAKKAKIELVQFTVEVNFSTSS